MTNNVRVNATEKMWRAVDKHVAGQYTPPAHAPDELRPPTSKNLADDNYNSRLYPNYIRTRFVNSG